MTAMSKCSFGEDGAEPGDLVRELAVFGRELVLLEAGQAREAHVEDGFGLTLAEAVILDLRGGLELRFWRPRAARRLLAPPKAAPSSGFAPRPDPVTRGSS